MNEIADDLVRSDSPRRVARWIAVLTLLTVAAGIYAQGYVSERLIVWRDAAATAANILSHRSLYISGLAAYLVEMACNVAGAVLFYELLKPAGRSLSLVAATLGLVACIIKTMGRVLFGAPVYLLGAQRFHVLGPEAMNEISLILLLVNDHAAGIAMSFFGFNGVLTGILMLRARFLPRILGVLSILGGVGWLAHLWPPLGYRIEGYLLPTALLGVTGTTFWFLAFGVNEERWFEQARVGKGRMMGSLREADGSRFAG
jgi:hypothetical protein